MAGVWITNSSGAWQRLQLFADSLVLLPGEPPHRGPRAMRVAAAGAVILRAAAAAGAAWILLSGTKAAVRVNGSRLDLGLRVLADKDEILLADAVDPCWHRLFFSTETLAQIEPYAGSGQRPVVCPRCRRKIVAPSDRVNSASQRWKKSGDARSATDGC